MVLCQGYFRRYTIVYSDVSTFLSARAIEDHDVQEQLWGRNPDTDRVQRCPLKPGISNRQKSSRLGAAVLAPLASPGRQFITDHGAAIRY
jgi:hypothetical protein